VFVAVSEPVAQGFVASLAHPGDNMTGFTHLEPTFGAKWLELLKAIAPRISRAALLFNAAATPQAALFSQSVEVAAPQFMVTAIATPVRGLEEVEGVITRLDSEPTGIIFPPDPFTVEHHKTIGELANRYGLPTVSAFRIFPVDGGLASYGVDVPDLFRQAGSYVDRIFRGEKPADLPVQQPTKFELAINLKTAKALGLEVPPALLARADGKSAVEADIAIALRDTAGRLCP
jgi:putative ABC transport system substrate-binding protein